LASVLINTCTCPAFHDGARGSLSGWGGESGESPRTPLSHSALSRIGPRCLDLNQASRNRLFPSHTDLGRSSPGCAGLFAPVVERRSRTRVL